MYIRNFLQCFSILYRQAFQDLDAKLKPYGITASQYMYILCICENEGLSQEQICDRLKLDRAPVARAAGTLEGKGYITRTVSADDRRQNQLYSTEKGKLIYGKITAIVEQYEADLLSGLTDIERDVMKSLLEKVIEGLY